MAQNGRSVENQRQAHAPVKERKTITLAYSTRHEIQFLQRLGQHRETTSRLSHVDLLKKYRGTMCNRMDWGQIDPKAIRIWLAVNIGDGR